MACSQQPTQGLQGGLRGAQSGVEGAGHKGLPACWPCFSGQLNVLVHRRVPRAPPRPADVPQLNRDQGRLSTMDSSSHQPALGDSLASSWGHDLGWPGVVVPAPLGSPLHQGSH